MRTGCPLDVAPYDTRGDVDASDGCVPIDPSFDVSVNTRRCASSLYIWSLDVCSLLIGSDTGVDPILKTLPYMP